MEFQLIEFDYKDLDHLNAVYAWDTAPEFFHLINPVPSPEEAVFPSFNEYIKRFNREIDPQLERRFLISHARKFIGYFSLQIDPPQVANKQQKTSWLGITIGDKEYWGKGASKFAMEHFERLSRELGAFRVELGVFEFNVRAQSFYKKLGYSEFLRLKDFTFYNGRYWEDVRMEKLLS